MGGAFLLVLGKFVLLGLGFGGVGGGGWGGSVGQRVLVGVLGLGFLVLFFLSFRLFRGFCCSFLWGVVCSFV